MDINEILSIALPVVYVIVGAVLVWLVIDLSLTVHARHAGQSTRSAGAGRTPLASVERITASLEPVAARWIRW